MPEGVPVSGTVTLDGKPLPGVNVTFIPVGSTRGDICFGLTDASGKYELNNRYGHSGAPAGEYKVTCTVGGGPGSDAPAEGAPAEPADASTSLPAHYTSEDATKLKATVPAGGGTIDFELTSGQ